METLSAIFERLGWKIIIPLMVIALALGYFIGDRGDKPAQSESASLQADSGHKDDNILFWTCSMHPQIHQPGPGKCPICGMDLIPVRADEEGSGSSGLASNEVKLSAYARKLAEIEVSPVKRMEVNSSIRMVGKIEYDETRLGYITAWVPGRIDRLYVDFTGTPVKKGAAMASLYSPELYAAQQELIEALKANQELKDSGLESIRTTALQTVEASREKLRLLGLTAGQIKTIEQKGKAEDHVTIYSPVQGVVIHKSGFEGMYVQTGARLYTVADLSKVWTRMDAYESDLAWLTKGQHLEITAEAYPGEVFDGQIEFIDPFLNPTTRTAKVRVTIPNKDGRLKPEMFVHGLVKLNSADLQRAGEGQEEAAQLLAIPSSSPLITGKRSVVYVAVPDQDGVYQGREITLGLRAGDYYLVKDGLNEGEMVVTNGAFKIDSAIQILAGPSMMNPEGGGPPPGHNHGSMNMSSAENQAMSETEPEQAGDAPGLFKSQLAAVIDKYFKLQQDLAADDLKQAQSASRKVLDSLDNVDMTLLSGDAHMAWMGQLQKIKAGATGVKESEDLEKARESFKILSDALNSSIHSFGLSGREPVYLIHCPMAFNNAGADWLQPGKEVHNPYYGKMMQSCGEVKETLNRGPRAHSHE